MACLRRGATRISSCLVLCVCLIWLTGLCVGCAPRQTTGSTPWPTKEWPISTPQEQGMDGAMLDRMLAEIEQRKLPFHSLLVIRNGYIVSETYFSPYRQDSRHELYSCTKSFMATLVGIAVDQGRIADINRPVLETLGRSFDNADPRKDAMTIEHLLTMTSGLDWAEGDSTYRAMYMSDDWVKYVLDLPMRDQPGDRFVYCSGCSHVLSAIVQQQAGMNGRDFAQRSLFAPLGINAEWDRDANNIPIGGWGLQLTSRDMAKLGYLYLHNGVWDGKQIVSSAWVRAAAQKHVAADSEMGYGYQWWIYPRFGAYTALGRYGQTIFVAPKDNLIVVTTAKLEGHSEIFDLIDNYIVPACGD